MPVFGKTLLAQDEELSILFNWLRYKGKGNALYNHFNAIASSYLSEGEKGNLFTILTGKELVNKFQP